MKNKKGFSLMELLIVVIIIAGFAALTYPSYVISIERSRVSEAINLLGTIQATQQKNFMSYESYGLKFKDINDFTPAIEDFDPEQSSFYTEYYKYELGDAASILANEGKVTATRVDKSHNNLDKGYSLEARYNERFVRCNFTNDEGEKICASVTDKDKDDSENYYPIY